MGDCCALGFSGVAFTIGVSLQRSSLSHEQAAARIASDRFVKDAASFAHTLTFVQHIQVAREPEASGWSEALDSLSGMAY